MWSQVCLRRRFCLQGHLVRRLPWRWSASTGGRGCGLKRLNWVLDHLQQSFDFMDFFTLQHNFSISHDAVSARPSPRRRASCMTSTWGIQRSPTEVGNVGYHVWWVDAWAQAVAVMKTKLPGERKQELKIVEDLNRWYTVWIHAAADGKAM